MNAQTPLAARMRPQQLAQFVGQSHLLGQNKPLWRMLQSGHLHSMVLWGPPGSGKTSLAKLIAGRANARFHPLSAVFSSVKDIKAVVDQVNADQASAHLQSILFLDEAHRFNKAQQDILLPYIENGTFIFIGATTENPSFNLNHALLSRVQVYKLEALTQNDIETLITEALMDCARGCGDRGVTIEAEARTILAKYSDGDARRALNFLEVAVSTGAQTITSELVNQLIGSQSRIKFDKQGDEFYEQISALHKAVRGSSPDAALYWYARMIAGGCDPLYIARRVVRMASEDIGNADPRGLQIALNAWDAQARLGSPEGELAIAHAIVFLASVPKSNAVYTAYKQALACAKQQGALPVPVHLRNAPTQLMQSLDYGKDYQYAHDYPQAYVPGECYLPEALQSVTFYQPTDRGLEKHFKDRLTELKKQDAQSIWRRYTK